MTRWIAADENSLLYIGTQSSLFSILHVPLSPRGLDGCGIKGTGKVASSIGWSCVDG
jgi:hypothetical protein